MYCCYVSLRATLHTYLQCTLVDGICTLSPVYYLCEKLHAHSSGQAFNELEIGTTVYAGSKMNAGEPTPVPIDVLKVDRCVVGTERSFLYAPFFSVMFFNTVVQPLRSDQQLYVLCLEPNTV
jgi:hypothetical protein